ncbi:transforming growth factor-beta-induced protein ig-h3 isoform X2 [Hydra vulgaris]|uniref:Transforming growth factor-beta-induced protein ig-h3 isoform X2 n=1 Tax=Hydra vulgaris TaxID=6087 RepID=A0ABM4CE24_HYDVU
MNKCVLIFFLSFIAGNHLYCINNTKHTVATALLLNGYSSFYELFSQIGLFNVLFDKEPYIIFIPHNNAVKEFQMLTFSQKKETAENLIFNNFQNISSFKDGQRLKSLNNKTFFINKHINKFRSIPRLWLQGAKLGRSSILTQKSILYEINHIPVLQSLTLETYLKSSGRHNFMLGLLEKYKAYFTFFYGATFFLPLDDSIKAMPSKYKNQIFNDDLKSMNFIRGHIINQPMCSQRLLINSGGNTFTNDIGHPLTVHQDLYNKKSFYVNGIPVISTTSLTNGWAYVIDGVILSEITNNLLESLPLLQCHTFLQYLIKTGHAKQLQNETTPHTLFVPTDQVFERLNKEIKKKLDSDDKYLMTFMKYHFLKGKYISEQFDGNSAIKTTAIVNQTYLKLHLQTYGEVSSVQNVLITKRDTLATNGIIHITNSVLIPPTQSLLDILQNTKNFYMFTQEILKNKILVKILSQKDVSFTVFVPTNRAIKRYEMSIQNSNISQFFNTELLCRHIGYKAFFTNHMFLNEELVVKTHEFNNGNFTFIKLSNKKNNEPTIVDYQSTLLAQNIIATNGVIHSLNKVLTNHTNESGSVYMRAGYLTKVIRVKKIEAK